VNYWVLARTILPFFVLQIGVLAVLVAVPEISLWLPRQLGFIGGR
jgi:TRAP-type C4-dicarboxylate transport system permease large subunit